MLHAAAAPGTSGESEHAVELADTSISAALPPPLEAEAATAEAQPVRAAIDQPAEQSIELDELPGTEQVIAQEVLTPEIERLEQAFRFDTRVEVAASEPTSNATEADIEPGELGGPSPIPTPVDRAPGPVKKAMLTRLADMLERMLSAKRSASGPEKCEPTSAPETVEPPSTSVEPSP